MNGLLVTTTLLFVFAGIQAAAVDSDKERITGIVVDSVDRPVAGIELRPHGAAAPAARTGLDGRFTITLGARDVRYSVLIANDESHARMGLWTASDDAPRPLEPSVEVRLVLKPSRAVKVNVTDASGKPVPGAKLVARHAYDVVAFAQTDVNGGATLRVPEDAKITEIAGVKAGVGFDYSENKASAKWLDAKPTPEEVSLELNGASRFQVRALDSAGKPIAGVVFLPWTLQMPEKNEYINLSGAPSEFPVSRTTNAEGLATFDFMPVPLKGAVSMLCRSKDWHQQKDPVWPPQNAVDTDTPVLETTLLRCGSASGMVLHANGTPAPGILIQAEGRGNTNHYCRRVTRTKRDGTFHFTLYPEQSYLVAITDKEWASPSTSGFIMREGEERNDLLFTLGKGTLLSGKVTHLHTGQPLGEKTVTVIERGAQIDGALLAGDRQWGERQESLVRWTLTDAQGRYAIRLGPGRYEVSADYAQEGRGEIIVGEKPELTRDFRITPRE